MIYNWIGRTVVAFVLRRYGTQIRFALGFGAAALALGAYLAAREVKEG